MLKRIIPFILTFAVGLIVASFFVSIIPSFSFKRGDRGKHHQELRYENERLKTENDRLKSERNFDIETVPMRVEEIPTLENIVPPPPMMKRTK